MATDVLPAPRVSSPAKPAGDLRHLLRRGLTHHQAGEWGLALALYEGVLAIDPNQPDGLNLTGVIAYQTGDHARAVMLLERACALDPRAPDFAINLGLAWQAGGDLDRARAAFERAVLLRPASKAGHLHLGNCRRLSGDLTGAIKACDRAVALDPEFAEAHAIRGAVLLTLGRPVEAIVACRRALGLIPSHFESLLNLGVALRSIDQLDEAAASLEAARVVRPSVAEPHLWLASIRQKQGRPEVALAAVDEGLGRIPMEPRLHAARGAVLKEIGRLDEAAAGYRRALDLDPASARVATNLGAVLTALGDFDGAERVLRQAIALDPSVPEAHLNLGSALKGKAEFPEAVAAYREALRCRPDYPEADFNIGNAWRDAGRFEEAIEAYDRALDHRPGYGDAFWNQALALLGDGQLARGWRQYEWRWRDGDRLILPGRLGAPRWTGEPVAGARVLVWREQGLGDELLFLTCVPDLVAAGARVTVLVSPRLVSLVQRAVPEAEVIGDGPLTLGGDRTFDWQVPMGSLPGILRNGLSEFRADSPLLAPDPAQLAKWRVRLATLPAGKRIGVCWRSGLVTPARRRNYAPLAAWEPFWAIPGVEWVNLQYDDCDADVAQVERDHGVRLRRWAGEDLKDDLESVVGLIGSLDGVVTAPTAIASLAGAVGTPAWQVDSGSDWSPFGADRSPWFPSLRVARKRPLERDWHPVIARVASAVTAWAHVD